MSGAAHGFVRKALPLTYSDLGEQDVKNIDEPVRAYAVRPPPLPLAESECSRSRCRCPTSPLSRFCRSRI